MGGLVPGTPVHALASPLDFLQTSAASQLKTRRRDIALQGKLAFFIEDVITAEEAHTLAAVGEALGFRDEAPGISTPPGMRMNQSVHWVADPAPMDQLLLRFQHLLPPNMGGHSLHPGLSHRINMYRYKEGDVFRPHTDGDWPAYALSPDRQTMMEVNGLRSRLTMLLYLNDTADGVQGGATRLFDNAGGHVDIEPRKGSALFFCHGNGPDSVLHEGRTITGTHPKYVARINVMYSA
jgi:hypothetical protein